MAYRRRYKSGGRVPAEEIPTQSSEVKIELDDPVSALLEPDPDDDAVARSVRSTVRAQELGQAQQQQPQQTVAEHIDALPGLTDHKRAFLKQHPEFVLDNSRRALLGKHYAAALQAGIADDSPEIDRFIVDAVARDTAEQRQDHRVAELLRSEPSPRSDPEPAPAARQDPLPDQRPAPRRSMPMTAPVTRSVPTGARRENFNNITLTAEQRLVARTAMSWLPHEEAERQYALNLRRMLQGKADGSIQ